MAGVSAGPEGKNNLNIELNLVPFIDLLSTLVLFLLVSAVWIQVSVMPAAVSSRGRAVSSTPLPESRLNVHLTPTGFKLDWPVPMPSLPKMVERDQLPRLEAVLKQAFEAKKITSVAVSGDEEVEYGAVVQAIDIAKSAGVTSVALSTN